jgi:transposase
VKVNPQDADAVNMVVRMDALFLVDRDARQKAMGSAERLAHRKELARPWMDEIRDVCRSLARVALPKSALGKAVTYTLNQWPKLARCLEHEEVELSNNLAENSMRPVALGRNYVHSRIMCSVDPCSHTIIRIDEPLTQTAASGLCA